MTSGSPSPPPPAATQQPPPAAVAARPGASVPVITGSVGGYDPVTIYSALQSGIAGAVAGKNPMYGR